MAKKYNTVGGGAQTNLNGLQFERDNSLLELIDSTDEYEVINTHYKRNGKIRTRSFVCFKNETIDKAIGEIGEKEDFYYTLLEPHDIDYKTIVTKKLKPDGYFYNYSKETVFIIEKKFQDGDGSVDEKLQSFPFKIERYEALLSHLDVDVKFVFILSDFFNKHKYQDLFDYMDKNGCKYFFNEIDLSVLGL